MLVEYQSRKAMVPSVSETDCWRHCSHSTVRWLTEARCACTKVTALLERNQQQSKNTFKRSLSRDEWTSSAATMRRLLSTVCKRLRIVKRGRMCILLWCQIVSFARSCSYSFLRWSSWNFRSAAPAVLYRSRHQDRQYVLFKFFEDWLLPRLTEQGVERVSFILPKCHDIGFVLVQFDELQQMRQPDTLDLIRFRRRSGQI